MNVTGQICRTGSTRASFQALAINNSRRVLAIGERWNWYKYWTPTLCDTDSFELRAHMGFYSRPNCGRREFLTTLGVAWDAGINLLWPSPVPGEWDAAEARRVADALAPRVLDYGAVLLFGARVCRAFDIPYEVGRTFEMQEEYSSRSTLAVPLPHPNGRNKDWNYAGVRGLVRETMSSLRVRLEARK